ncbi:hypothetical protein KPHVMX_480206 [Klebsiella pneumoniae]|nr:hypothetical protein KPHVMX_480206 [Klebsiella pneumoniae]SBN28060.1 hypothetical protein KPMX200_250231 [Klebsiella pneumoniae]
MQFDGERKKHHYEYEAVRDFIN